jgi:hypothetical protein
MKKLVIAIVLSCAGIVKAQDGGVKPPPSVKVQDEGGAASFATTLNCTGAGITCSVSNAVATLNATGGAGGANTVEVSVNLGTTWKSVATATVTGQAWVTSSSIIVCSPFATTADGQTIENYIAADLGINAATRVVGTGFDIWIRNNYGAVGTFRFHCTGA